MTALPAGVVAAQARAEAAGFPFSSAPGVGALLACLAAGVPAGGRILELGTGVGCGLAWMVDGLGDRTDVEVVTVEVDEARQALARSVPWPDVVRFERGDGAALLPHLGSFDLIFADAAGGKTTGLSSTLAALRPGATLVVDDMDIDRHDSAELRRNLADVRTTLLADDRLVCGDLDFSSGVILAVRRW